MIIFPTNSGCWLIQRSTINEETSYIYKPGDIFAWLYFTGIVRTNLAALAITSHAEASRTELLLFTCAS